MRVFLEFSRMGRLGGVSVPSRIQETFILLFSLGTMCWSREPALLHGPLLFWTQAQKPPRWQTWSRQSQLRFIVYGLRCTKQQNFKAAVSTKTAWKDQMCSVTPSAAQVCRHVGFVRQHLFLLLLSHNKDRERAFDSVHDNRKQVQWCLYSAVLGWVCTHM